MWKDGRRLRVKGGLDSWGLSERVGGSHASFFQHFHGAVQGDCARGHDRSAPGLKRGAFLGNLEKKGTCLFPVRTPRG